MGEGEDENSRAGSGGKSSKHHALVWIPPARALLKLGSSRWARVSEGCLRRFVSFNGMYNEVRAAAGREGTPGTVERTCLTHVPPAC